MLRTVFPWRCNNDWASHPPFVLTEHLSQTDLRGELWVRTRGPRLPPAPFVHAAIADRMRHLGAIGVRINRTFQPKNDWMLRLVEKRYLSGIQRGDAVNLYRACTLRLLEAFKAKGAVVMIEMMSTMAHTGIRILEDAYRRAGWPIHHDLGPRELQEDLDQELRKAQRADFFFSPSPLVAESLRAVGVPDHKILATSYGWDPQRFTGPATRALPEISGLTLLFVGTVSERKGAHLLLEAWRRLRLDGRLLLVGPMGLYMATQVPDLLTQPGITHVPWHDDVAPYFRSADMFVFPTLDEGSPLVIYEAMGMGLPIITSPMGAGEVLRHGKEGLVIDPDDQDALIGAIRLLAGDADLRRSLGEAARVRAAEYTWDRVAARRHELIRNALRSHGTYRHAREAQTA
jgi:glycosyltransferase involved in cell wall biosynthesis